MLRALPRAVPSLRTMRSTPLRSSFRTPAGPTSACIVEKRSQQARLASTTHAISNPTLADIEKRWEGLPPQEQADLWMALRDRMKIDWHDLTLQERKAAYWIAFGPHGPRAQPYPPGTNWWILKWVSVACLVSGVIFWAIRQFARGPPKTLNAQWEEMTNEYLRNQKVEPITGLSSEGYKGKGQVQSPPRKGGLPEDDDE